MLVPLLDILQSIPILGFLSITVTGFIAPLLSASRRNRSRLERRLSRSPSRSSVTPSVSRAIA